ncbi:hypothetical protein [Phormidesmis sp. 146-33]
MQPKIIVGNAHTEGEKHRGWFVGHFIESADPRSTTALEVKWGVHLAGEGRSQWAPAAKVTTISILICGKFWVRFPDQEVLLSVPGAYVLWLPGVAHSWLAEADSTVLTVRYPSVS